MDTIAAIDIGTTGAKTTLIDRRGAILAAAYAGYATQGEGNRVEQDPADWWTAALAGLRAVLAQAGDARPAAVALSGQMQDLILLDGDVLAPAILYSDTRAEAEAEAVRQAIGEERLQQVTGNLQDASGLLAKLLWLKRAQPHLYQQAGTLFLGAHDYVAWKLCGARVTDCTTAATTGLLDLGRSAWAEDLLAALDLRRDWLPQLAPADAIVGTLDGPAAALTGLPAGIPVFHGAGDAATTTLGAGAGEPGVDYGYLGTSGWLAASSEGSAVDPGSGIYNLRHPDPRRLILVGPMLTAAGNFEWLAQQFGALEEAAGGSRYEILNALAAEADPGSGGLLYLPYLAGERAPFRDAHARGVFCGLSRRTTRREMYRAVLEGVALAMRTIRAAMPGQTAGRRELRLAGGGARSPLWPQIFADVFASPVQVLAAPGDVGARGAALIAAHGLGWQSSYSASPEFCPIAASYEPAAEAVAVYDRLFRAFRDLYPALKSVFIQLDQTEKGTEA